MNIFLTYNEKFNGIFQSQVIEVLKNYKISGIEFKLICFLSLRGFFSERKKIKSQFRLAFVFPMFPKLKNWKIHTRLVAFLLKDADLVICRGIFTTNLALRTNSSVKIIYDGRGAINAEQIEYGVYNNTGIENKIYHLEKRAILNTDYRISVSTKLVNYWRKEYNFKSDNYVVIPSTSNHEIKFFNAKHIDFQIKEDDILVVFSGSLSKWHSFPTMLAHFESFLEKNSHVKILILSKKNNQIKALINKHPNRIINKWVSPDKVFDFLVLADYGYVYREDSVTNRVASPVKIAEYLSCGLKIIISENLGDYSEMVEKYNLGHIIKNDNTIYLEKVNAIEKEKIISFYRSNLALFSKKISQRYLNLINENCSYN